MSSDSHDKREPRDELNCEPEAPNLYSTQNYWIQLKQDLLAASHSVVVICPYLTRSRSEEYLNVFYTLLTTDRSVKVITMPPESHRYQMISQSRSVIGLLLAIDVDLTLVPRIHQKIILIDDRICWEGSMNWLSHTSDTAEHIRRIADRKLVAEVRKSLSFYVDRYSIPVPQVAECFDPHQTNFDTGVDISVT